MGFERNYQIKILTKQLNIRYFFNMSIQSNVNHLFITDLSDAEASFIISIYYTEKL